MNVRAAAATVLFEVVDQGYSLSNALPAAQQTVSPRDHALLQEMCYGALRVLPRLESIVNELMESPLKGKQRIFHHLMLIGIYQLSSMRIPPHAAISDTVEGAKALRGPRLAGLINAILRNYQRRQEELDTLSQSHNAGKYVHPSWLLKMLQQDYPTQWEDIVEANNKKAPMWLRVNSQHHTRDEYKALLDEQEIESEIHPQAVDALRLVSPCDVKSLPGFDLGWVSVQDAAAQLAVDYLTPKAGELILDCCAAPGGKTAHILERTGEDADHNANSQVIAIDCDNNRLTRVHDNLDRLNLQAEVICGDARYPEEWWNGEKFDRILLDAPCSATGVIRRHPDIKWLRRANDIDALSTLQSEIIDAMWRQLKPGGTLVYATCSILSKENKQQVSAFLERTKDAQLIDSDLADPGRQIIAGEDDMDGFYYAVLQKNN